MTINNTTEMSAMQALALGHSKLDALLDADKKNMPAILSCLLALNTLLEGSTERFTAPIIALAHQLYTKASRVLNAHTPITMSTPFPTLINYIYGDLGQSIFTKLLDVYKDEYSLQFMRELVIAIERSRVKNLNKLCVSDAEE